ncbi:MAG: hypothetical protein P8184_01965 [Calditrichia bacterium]
MTEEQKGMKPIWYFVGLVLLAMGAIIFGTGLYHLFTGTERVQVLSGYYPDAWWGGLMAVVGLIFFLISRKAKV